MNKLKHIAFLTFTVLIFLGISSCAEQTLIPEEILSPEDFTHLDIILTDSSDTDNEVFVDIRKVLLMTNKSEDEIEMSTYADICNLKNHQKGTQKVLAEADLIDVKKIFQIRLELGLSNQIKIDGIVYPLVLENIQENLQIHSNISLDTTLKKEIILDFNSEKSVVEERPGVYYLRPHIRITD